MAPYDFLKDICKVHTGILFIAADGKQRTAKSAHSSGQVGL